MTGWDSSLTQMREVLAYLYNNAASAKRIAADAGLDTTKIDFTGNASNIWQGILEYAVKSGQVENLIAVVQNEFPNNDNFENAVSAYRLSAEKEAEQPANELDREKLYSHENQIRLIGIMNDGFELGELEDLTFRLGIDIQNISGSTKSAKTRGLVQYLVRRNNLEELIRVGAKLRPDIDWV